MRDDRTKLIEQDVRKVMVQVINLEEEFVKLIRPQLMDILACPSCDSSEMSYITEEEPCIRCEQCGERYGFENKIPLLYKDDEFWAPKKREAAGWVSLWQELFEGSYEENKEIVPDVDLPFTATEGPWFDVKRMFEAALSQMELRGGERILDIGAGEGWASLHFARQGCQAVAMDVVPDLALGLGRAWKRMELTGVNYDLVIGDNERLPFQPETFDFVFSSNTLHHSNNLNHLFANIYRVLRPGGQLIAIGDPLISVFEREKNTLDGERERAHGIVERRRRYYHYWAALLRAGFRRIHGEEAQTFGKADAELYPWLAEERIKINQDRLLGVNVLTKLLSWSMMRLPRPLALPLLLTLRRGNLLLVSAQKPG